MSDVSQSYNLNCSTITITIKNKDKTVEHVRSFVTMISTIISKKCQKVVEEIERLLSVRIGGTSSNASYSWFYQIKSWNRKTV